MVDGCQRGAVDGNQVPVLPGAFADDRDVNYALIVRQRGSATHGDVCGRRIATERGCGNPGASAIRCDAGQAALQTDGCRAEDQESEEEIPIRVGGQWSIDLNILIVDRGISLVVLRPKEVKMCDGAGCQVWICSHHHPATDIGNEELIFEERGAKAGDELVTRRLVARILRPQAFAGRAVVSHYTETVRACLHRHDHGVGCRDQRRTIVNEDLTRRRSEVYRGLPMNRA